MSLKKKGRVTTSARYKAMLIPQQQAYDKELYNCAKVCSIPCLLKREPKTSSHDNQIFKVMEPVGIILHNVNLSP